MNISDRDLLSIPADVIVNSANPSLGGIGPDLPDGVGGVDGAVHRAAGIGLWQHLQALPISGELKPGWFVRCWPGHCVVTPAFGLAAKHIVHGVAPVFDPASADRCFQVLRDLYGRIFDTIATLHARTVAIPPLGTRSYGFPKAESAEIAVERARVFDQSTTCEVTFSVIDDQERAHYSAVLRASR
jgi:O-acetyl-ADP-ribose deacetylase (regulator of RNase III)